MNTEAIKTAATAAGLSATIEGATVFVTCVGPAGAMFMHGIIDAGATYLGAVKSGDAAPLGARVDSYGIVRRFSA